jgi:DNA modification methylase
MKLYKGDCLEVMKQIPNGSIDAIITDPPYGVTSCKWDSVIPFELMWAQLNRIIKPNGAIVLFGSEPFSSALRMSNVNNYKYDWKWKKNISSGFQLAKIQPRRAIEDIIIFYKSQPTYNPEFIKSEIKDRKIINGKKNGGGRSNNIKNEHRLGAKARPNIMKNVVSPHNLLNFNVAKRSGKRLHPTQKPILLMEYLIKTYTNENETVLDFTMGSGSTGLACVNTNRHFIGIEMDDEYFDIATKRINEAQLKLF